jgi:hypothetical protein
MATAGRTSRLRAESRSACLWYPDQQVDAGPEWSVGVATFRLRCLERLCEQRSHEIHPEVVYFIKLLVDTWGRTLPAQDQLRKTCPSDRRPLRENRCVLLEISVEHRARPPRDLGDGRPEFRAVLPQCLGDGPRLGEHLSVFVQQRPDR